jgi:hypothetical protein
MATKNMISLARKSQIPTFPGGVGSPWVKSGSGAWASER